MRLSLSALLLAIAVVPRPGAAQAVVQPLPGSTDADRLAGQMRLLASNPNDVSALLAAGELSLRLDDLGAAASFFARADKVDPRNGRAKAGEASILVHAERPGEALRYFALAESYGLAPSAFAADRGLAYDLIGEQERAQRDYRLALRTPGAGSPEETQRRYALSLAIAGKRDLADQQLQPLLRRSDRGAWRAHAFVLAMAGNLAEASRIATTMMPPGTAAGLQPFLQRLPTLAPVDRAFAVHFGEVRPSPQRIADARMTPALPALGPDPFAPRAMLAAATPADKGKKGKEKKRGKRDAVQVAVATPAPEPLPQAPSYRGRPGAPVVVATRGTAPAAWPTAVVPTGSRPPLTLAANRNLPATAFATTATSAPRANPAVVPSTIAPAARPTPAPSQAVPLASNAVAAAVPPTAAPSPIVIASPRPAPLLAMAVVPVPALPTAAVPGPGAPPPETDVVVSSVGTPTPATIALPSASPAASAELASATPIAPGTAPAARPTAITPETPRPALAAAPAAGAPTLPAPVVPQPTVAQRVPPVRSRGGETALGRIVAGLPIPAAELGVAGPARAPAATAIETVGAEPAVDQAAIARADRAAAAKVLADKRAADRKAAAEKKALAEKKAAAEQKAEEAREAAAQKKLARANPKRIWVQVAGGANVNDLPKAWAAAKVKGGDAFAGHASGWTTPLRATNRVLAGPFKTDAEARTLVNKLRGEGLPAFAFTSEAGQPVTKLPAK